MTTQQLQQAVNYIFPTALLGHAWTATTDSTGNASIVYWNAGIGTQPTDTELATALAAVQLSNAKMQQANVIAAAYSTATYATPVSIVVGSNTLSFPTDEATQNNLAKYLAVFAGMSTKPSAVPLADVNGVAQTLTPAQLQTLAEAILSQSAAAWSKLKTLQASITAATTISEVQAVVW